MNKIKSRSIFKTGLRWLQASIAFVILLLGVVVASSAHAEIDPSVVRLYENLDLGSPSKPIDNPWKVLGGYPSLTHEEVLAEMARHQALVDRYLSAINVASLNAESRAALEAFVRYRTEYSDVFKDPKRYETLRLRALKGLKAEAIAQNKPEFKPYRPKDLKNDIITGAGKTTGYVKKNGPIIGTSLLGFAAYYYAVRSENALSDWAQGKPEPMRRLGTLSQIPSGMLSIASFMALFQGTKALGSGMGSYAARSRLFSKYEFPKHKLWGNAWSYGIGIPLAAGIMSHVKMAMDTYNDPRNQEAESMVALADEKLAELMPVWASRYGYTAQESQKWTVNEWAQARASWFLGKPSRLFSQKVPVNTGYNVDPALNEKIDTWLSVKKNNQQIADARFYEAYLAFITYHKGEALQLAIQTSRFVAVISTARYLQNYIYKDVLKITDEQLANLSGKDFVLAVQRTLKSTRLANSLLLKKSLAYFKWVPSLNFNFLVPSAGIQNRALRIAFSPPVQVLWWIPGGVLNMFKKAITSAVGPIYFKILIQSLTYAAIYDNVDSALKWVGDKATEPFLLERLQSAQASVKKALADFVETYSNQHPYSVEDSGAKLNTLTDSLKAMNSEWDEHRTTIVQTLSEEESSWQDYITAKLIEFYKKERYFRWIARTRKLSTRAEKWSDIDFATDGAIEKMPPWHALQIHPDALNIEIKKYLELFDREIYSKVPPNQLGDQLEQFLAAYLKKEATDLDIQLERVYSKKFSATRALIDQTFYHASRPVNVWLVDTLRGNPTVPKTLAPKAYRMRNSLSGRESREIEYETPYNLQQSFIQEFRQLRLFFLAAVDKNSSAQESAEIRLLSEALKTYTEPDLFKNLHSVLEKLSVARGLYYQKILSQQDPNSKRFYAENPKVRWSIFARMIADRFEQLRWAYSSLPREYQLLLKIQSLREMTKLPPEVERVQDQEARLSQGLLPIVVGDPASGGFVVGADNMAEALKKLAESDKKSLAEFANAQPEKVKEAQDKIDQEHDAEVLAEIAKSEAEAKKKAGKDPGTTEPPATETVPDPAIGPPKPKEVKPSEGPNSQKKPSEKKEEDQ